MTVVTDSESGITAVYTYDLIGRLARYTETGTDHSVILNYTYDQEGKLTYLAETINGEWRGIYYYYDAENRVRLVDKGNGGRGYTYDDFGRLSQKYTRHVGYTRITDDFVYTTNGNTTSAQVAQHIITTGVGTDNVVTTTYSYTYDDNGNILTVFDGTHTTSYVYDSANQLIRENNQAGGFTHTWTYDNAGNILSRKEYSYTTGSLEGITPTDTVTYTYGDEDWGDLLTAYNGQTITYDEIGNPLSDGTWTYSWQHGRELSSMTDGTVTWNYTYNADGLRTKRTNGTTTYSYAYVGSELERLTIGTEKLAFAYDADGVPLTVRWNGTYYFYLTNLQGDVIAITDETGAVVVTYTYDAWGNPLSTSGTMATTLGALSPLRYRGYVYDQETGLYYLQSRYYNPEIGRFINADNFVSTGQGLLSNNMFVYCLNNPVIFIDKNGNTPLNIIVNSVETKNSGVFYTTTITYTRYVEDSVTYFSYSYTRTISIDYKIENGVILVDNKEQNIYALPLLVQTKLSEEMHYQAKLANSKALQGRSSFGIMFEALAHSLAYVLGILTKSSEESYIGTTDEASKGYDKNAWFFEFSWLDKFAEWLFD